MMARVAAIQMNSSDDVEQNLRLTAELVEESKRQSAKLVVLPECFALMARNQDQRLACAEPMHGGGEIETFLSNLSREHQIWILGAGVFTHCQNPSKVRNTSYLLDDHGNLVARYDKINLFDVVLADGECYSESSYTAPGNDLVTRDTPAGVVGMTVCYDIRFPQLYQTLAAKGAVWFAVPSAFAYTTGRDHWEVLLRARAIENHAYVVAPAQWGIHCTGRKTFGHTMIVDPWGNIIAHKVSDDGVVIGEIIPDRIGEIRGRFGAA